MEENGNIIIYQTEDGLTKLDVQLHDETVWHLLKRKLLHMYQCI